MRKTALTRSGDGLRLEPSARKRLAAHADTLEWALVQAYQNNPSLNAQRASLRATDENVPQALSGYRPKLSITATGGYNYQNSTSVSPARDCASPNRAGAAIRRCSQQIHKRWRHRGGAASTWLICDALPLRQMTY
jgi:outer membrane protein TolC